MSEEIKSSPEMSDKDFVVASKKYFKRARINLHIGCCLVAKINPEAKKVPVGKGYLDWDDEPEPEPESEPEPYDYTRRPFSVALRALNGEIPQNPLVPAEPVPRVLKDASDIVLSTRTFISWVIEQWPNTSHMKAAEDYYQSQKAASPAGYLSNTKTASATKWANREAAFKDLMDSLGKKAKPMSARALGDTLEKKIKNTEYAAKSQTLRKRISTWRNDMD